MEKFISINIQYILNKNNGYNLDLYYDLQTPLVIYMYVHVIKCPIINNGANIYKENYNEVKFATTITSIVLSNQKQQNHKRSKFKSVEV